MLMAINNISPRGVYVCGSYSSTTGLTVTLMKESGTGDYSLEAGIYFRQHINFYKYFNSFLQEHWCWEIRGAVVLMSSIKCQLSTKLCSRPWNSKYVTKSDIM